MYNRYKWIDNRGIEKILMIHRRIIMEKNLNEIAEKILRELQDIKVLLQETKEEKEAAKK